MSFEIIIDFLFIKERVVDMHIHTHALTHILLGVQEFLKNQLLVKLI